MYLCPHVTHSKVLLSFRFCIFSLLDSTGSKESPSGKWNQRGMTLKFRVWTSQKSLIQNLNISKTVVLNGRLFLKKVKIQVINQSLIEALVTCKWRTKRNRKKTSEWIALVPRLRPGEVKCGRAHVRAVASQPSYFPKSDFFIERCAYFYILLQ